DGIVGAQTIAVLQRTHGRIFRLGIQAQVRGQIDRWSRYYGVDDRLACALAWMESGHQPGVVSSTGAWGVFQIQPTTWDYVEHVLADRRYPRNVEGQVRVGLLFLRHLLQTFGDRRKALAAWYTGPARVRRYGIGRRGAWFAADVLALQRRGWAALELVRRPAAFVEAAGEWVERCDELSLRSRRRLVGSKGGLQVGAAVGRPAALAARQPVAVVPIRGERGVHRLLEQIGRVECLLGVRDREG